MSRRYSPPPAPGRSPAGAALAATLQQAVALHQQGRLAEAAAGYQSVLRVQPKHFDALQLSGVIALQLGRPTEGLALLDRALAIDARHAVVHLNHGNALRDLERYADALRSYERALRLAPNDVGVLSRRGTMLQRLRRPDEALASFDRALRLAPGHPEVLHDRGTALGEQGRLAEAEADLRQTLAACPDNEQSLNSLGSILQQQGRLSEAEAIYRRALALYPRAVAVLVNLAVLYKEQGRLNEAENACRQALEIAPQRAEAHSLQANVLKELGRLGEAEHACRQALALHPGLAHAWNILGGICKYCNRLGEAENAYRQCLALEPDSVLAHSNLLFLINRSGQHTPAECLASARAFGRLAAGKVTRRYTRWNCDAAPNRLRVGLVSGDLRQHPVGFFLENILACLDLRRLELIAYPTWSGEDQLTARLRPKFSAWRPLVGKNDTEAAALIHADGVHVLIDLAGHTAHNRLPLFAWKPAPLQISWLGDYATTGLAEIDYLLADAISVPTEHQEHFIEKIWYLPDTRLCFTPPAEAPPVAPLPALANGFVTFGSFQILAKLGDPVLAAWARILAACPDARLRIQALGLADAAVIDALRRRLATQGLDPARVDLSDSMPKRAYLEAHAEVDLLLDSFPIPGGATTCDGLWMGVPTITLAGGATMAARQGVGLLSAAGLPDWVAHSVDAYVELALAKAGDLTTLAIRRSQLRDQLRTSALCDSARFANNFEHALWGMWRQSCNHQPFEGEVS